MSKKLSDLCDVFTDGDWIESKDQSDEGIRLIQTGNIGIGKYLDKANKAKYISEETFKCLKCTEVFPGDILVSRLPDPIGRACIVPQSNEKMITAVDCTICRTKTDLILKEYLCYYMQSKAYYKKLFNNVTGTTRKRISRKNLGNIEIDIHTKIEQEKIIKKLDLLSSIIENRTKEVSYFDNLVKARFVEMFGDPITNSRNWPIVELGSLTEVGSSKRIFEKEYVSEGIPFYRTKEIVELSKGNSISTELYISRERYLEIKNLYGVPQKDDLLISAVGTIGTIWVVDGKQEFYFKDGNLLRIKHSDKFESVYMKYLLECLIDEYKNRMSSGTAYAALTISGLSAMKIYDVPKLVQHKFTEFAQQIDKSKVVVQKSLEKTQQLFDKLMQDYFG